MKFVQIITGCDMTKAETGERVPAAETVYLAIGPDPARLDVRELDLADDWAKALREALAPYLAASHAPGELGLPGSGSTGKPARANSNDPQVRAFNKARIEWAQANGYNLTKLAKGNSYYPPRKTQRAFAHHLAGEDHLLTRENKLQPDYDPRTVNPV